jgi:hypothetical protein
LRSDTVSEMTVTMSAADRTSSMKVCGNFKRCLKFPSYYRRALPRSRIDECVTYTITIAAAGHPTYTVNSRGFSGNAQGNEHRQLFALSPPTPTMMSGC